MFRFLSRLERNHYILFKFAYDQLVIQTHKWYVADPNVRRTPYEALPGHSLTRRVLIEALIERPLSKKDTKTITVKHGPNNVYFGAAIGTIRNKDIPRVRLKPLPLLFNSIKYPFYLCAFIFTFYWITEQNALKRHTQSVITLSIAFYNRSNWHSSLNN